MVIVLSERPKSGAKSFRSPRPDAPRLLAYSVFSQVNREGAFANLTLPKALADSDLETRDKGIVTELVYGTLRMQGTYDWMISQVIDRPFEEVDESIIDVCRLGLHQLFNMRVPTHAAVSATVELARKVSGDSRASYINALLRKLSAQTLETWMHPVTLLKDPVERLAILHSHPEWIVSAYFDLLKNEELVEAALIANNVPASPTFVAWPGRSTQQDLIDIGGTPLQYSLYGTTSVDIPTNVELIRKRLAGVQDEGSQLVVQVFANAAADQRSWLDLCAGPGGKSALLSSLAQLSGKSFSANEISQSRADLVAQVVVDTELWVGDGRHFAAHGKKFGAILVDVPCTGIGALRRRPEVRWRRTPKDLAELSNLQGELLQAAVDICEIGGLIAYVTCSPHLAETKVQIASALRRDSRIEQMSVLPFLPEALSGAVIDGAMQLWTHVHGTDAMFMALLRRVS